MTALIIQALILVLSIIFFAILVSWAGKSSRDKFIDKMFSRKEELIDKAIDKVSSAISSEVEWVTDQYETGPWYISVYTQESSYPIWISNNNIRSIHPDSQNRKLIVKQFQGKDMVIENVVKYKMYAANQMRAHEM